MANFTKAELLVKRLEKDPSAVLNEIEFELDDCLIRAIDISISGRCGKFKTCNECVDAWCGEDSGVPNPWDDILIY